MTKRAAVNQGERGAALVTVLTMVAIMSALAVVAVDAASMSVRRTFNQTRMEQTHWYLLGAEAFAIGKLEEMRRAAREGAAPAGDWHGRVLSFPLDDGMMRVVLYDGGNCFNLNSVVRQAEDDAATANAGGVMQFALLLDLLGVHSDRAALGATLADWIDADTLPSPGGLEDGAGRDGARYRPSNTLLADFSELRRVEGFSDDVIARIAPHVCVRPTAAPNFLNPNTLTPDDAPLLAMVLPDIDVAEARGVIRDRPRGGWSDLDAFFSHPRLAGLEQNELRRASFTLEPVYYVMIASVERDGGRETQAALIRMRPQGGGVVRRVFGVAEAERAL